MVRWLLTLLSVIIPTVVHAGRTIGEGVTATNGAIHISTQTGSVYIVTAGTLTVNGALGLRVKYGIIAGTVTANTFTGTLAGQASSVASGGVSFSTITNALNNISTGNFSGGFNAASQLVQLRSDTKYPALDGSLITGIVASSPTTVSYSSFSFVNVTASVADLTFLSCKSTTSITPVASTVTIFGDGAASVGSASRSGAFVLQNGAFLSGESTTVGLINAGQASAGFNFPFSFRRIIGGLTPGTAYNFCVGFNNDAGATLTIPGSLGNQWQFGVREDIFGVGPAGATGATGAAGAGSETNTYASSKTFTGGRGVLVTYGVSASTFVGNGAGLTSLTASNLVGAVPTASVDHSTITTALNNISTGNFSGGFNGASKLVQLDSSSKLPAVDGSQLTNLSSSGESNTYASSKTFTNVMTSSGIIDGSNAKVGYLGEYFISSGTALNFGTTGTWGDAGSLSLTPGDWDIVGQGMGFNQGTFTRYEIAITTISGNSSVNMTIGDNRVLHDTVATFETLCVKVRINLTSSKTVYLKYYADWGAVAPLFYWSISSRRIR